MEIAVNITMIEWVRTLVDAGIVLLVWLVQLVIYPTFSFMHKAALLQWHLIYTRRITFFVMPLMLVQMGIYSYQFLFKLESNSIFGLFLLAICWFITFAKAIPLHNAIDNRPDSHHETIVNLLQWNKIRAILWTIILIAGLGFILFE